MSESLLRALDVADANMYLCSEDIRPGEAKSFIVIHSIQLLVEFRFRHSRLLLLRSQIFTIYQTKVSVVAY